VKPFRNWKPASSARGSNAGWRAGETAVQNEKNRRHGASGTNQYFHGRPPLRLLIRK
jgi:hypothetical protein